MAKSYKRIESVRVSISILQFLSEQKGPVSAQEISRALELPHGTVMCHLATVEEERLVRCVGGAWELDMGMAMFWARKKAQLADTIAQDQTKLHNLGE